MLVQTCMIKLMELTLAVACLALHLLSYDLTDVPTLMLCSGTYVGYIAVFAGEIIGEVMSALPHVYVEAWWSSSGSVMFAACALLTLSSWNGVPECPRRARAETGAMCALANATILLFDGLILILAILKDNADSRMSRPMPFTRCM